MNDFEEALERIQEWRDRSEGGVGIDELSLLLAAVLSTVDFKSRAEREGPWKTKGHTPLHALAMRDDAMEVQMMRGSVKLLKDCGLDINAQRGEENSRDEGETPLTLAALYGHFGLVQALVEEGADVNKSDNESIVPLAQAAGGIFGDSTYPTIVAYLLKHEATVKDSFALSSAAAAGCPESVSMLLKAGAEVEERQWDTTPVQSCCAGLGWGSTSDRLEALSLLLEAGADLNVKDEVGRKSLMHRAASAGHGELIDDLFRRGLAVDAKDSDQRTPLHFAAMHGSSTCMKALIRLGASLDAVDSDKNTPLHLALQHEMMDMAAELIDAGSNVNAKRDGNMAPLHLAAARGSMRLAYLLLEAGAEVDALTDGGSSPLMVCISMAKDNNVSALLPRGWLYRSREGRRKVTALLLEVGAAVSKPVMALVGESDCGDVVAASLSEERGARHASDRVCSTVARHFSGSAYSEAAKEGRVVRVRLADRATGERKETQYTLSIPLMELLMGKTGGRRREGGLSDASDRDDTATGSFRTMLDPAGRGFMGIKGKAKDEVEVTFDGVDFTEEGFAAVVQFVTTGSVKSLLTRGSHGPMSSSSSSETVGGGDGRDDGSRSEAAGGRKRHRVKLFDEVKAQQAVQAAGFFCIEAMSREVKALITLYGFELAKGGEEEEPPRKRSREGLQS